jgi:DNA-binding response OmpR family regulator
VPPGSASTYAVVSGTQTPEYAGPVLLIDDDLGFLDSLTVLLESHGFRVLTANNGTHGLQMFRAHAPVVVVTDIMMPEQDGIGAMLQMRRERPGVKIVVISGGGKVDRSNYLVVAEQLGADAAFPKTDADALIDALDAILRREP